MILENVISKLPKHEHFSYGKRSLSEITQIIIHHSAGSLTAEETARYHVEDRGWPGIGYHFIITPGGFVQMTNALDTISYHCKGENTKSIGICLQGNFEQSVPFVSQIDALSELVRMLKELINPGLKVYGHRDKRATLCPGKHLYESIQPILTQ